MNSRSSIYVTLFGIVAMAVLGALFLKIDVRQDQEITALRNRLDTLQTEMHMIKPSGLDPEYQGASASDCHTLDCEKGYQAWRSALATDSVLVKAHCVAGYIDDKGDHCTQWE